VERVGEEKGYIRLVNARGETIGMTKEWQIPPGAFDYTIFKESNVVKAKNERDGKIEFKSTKLHEVFNEITSSKEPVYIKIATGKYTVEGQMNLYEHQFVNAYGAEFNVENGYDGDIFYIAPSDKEYPPYNFGKARPTGIAGAFFYGDFYNRTAQCIHVDSLPFAVIIKDVHFVQVRSGIYAEGNAYQTIISNVYARWVDHGIQLVQKGGDLTNAPWSSMIHNVDIETGDGEGIYIKSGMDIKISNVKVEGYPTQIHIDSNSNVFITNVDVYAKDATVGIKIGQDASAHIANAYIDGGGNVTLIELHNNSEVDITNSELIVIDPNNAHVLRNVGTAGAHVKMSNTKIQMKGSASGDNYVLRGIFSDSKISNVNVYGTGNETFFSGSYCEKNSIIGNYLYNIAKAYDFASTSKYNVIAKNTYVNVANYGSINEQYNYADDHLYTSLPDTSNSIVSELFKNRPIHYYDGTNYYLAVWDGSTWRMVQLT